MKQLEPVIVSHLFPELLNELIDLMRGLTKDEWNCPTICGPWSVKDVCAHLLGVEIGNLSWRRDGFSSFLDLESYEQLVQLINDHNDRWVKSARNISPRLLIDMLKFNGEQGVEFFQSIDPFEMGVPIDWIGPDPAPVWVDLAREYTERWHHQQHIRDAVDKPGLKDTRFLGPILDTFILGVPRTFRSNIAEEDTAIQIRTKGVVSRNWILAYKEDAWRLYEGALDNPQASVSIPDDVAWRIFTNGIPLDDARKQVQLFGDQYLAEKVLDTISIIA